MLRRPGKFFLCIDRYLIGAFSSVQFLCSLLLHNITHMSQAINLNVPGEEGVGAGTFLVSNTVYPYYFTTFL
jgi:hypothetical protein